MQSWRDIIERELFLDYLTSPGKVITNEQTVFLMNIRNRADHILKIEQIHVMMPAVNNFVMTVRRTAIYGVHMSCSKNKSLSAAYYCAHLMIEKRKFSTTSYNVLARF